MLRKDKTIKTLPDKVQLHNYQVSKKVVHEIKLGDIAVMEI